MSLQVEKLEHNMAKLTIEVGADEVEKAIQAAYLKQRGKLSIPGFRKGKVPRQMIEKMYGVEIFYEDAINRMIPTAYSQAYDECGLDIVSQPEVDVVQMEKGKPFIFTAEVATKPEVTLGEYKGLKVDKVPVEVTAEDVDAEIKRELERNARTVEVTDRSVQKDDMVTLDYEGFVDGEAFEGGKGTDYPLTIGSGAFIPGFEDQLIGAEIGQEMEVNVTFPEQYHSKELAGKEAVFKCTVHTIKEKELPELDDEFASDVSECETLAEYRQEVEKKLTERKQTQAREQIEDQAVDQAAENAQMDIPQPMIDLQVRQMEDDMGYRLQMQGMTKEMYFQMTGLTEDRMKQDMEAQAVKTIRTRLVLEAVAKAENIVVSEERLEEELKKMAETYGREVEALKEQMGEKRIEEMKESIAVQDAITLIADAAVEA
ncbi:MAG: trigger factor [Ruminococcus sp.]|uniref:Trigger factor n=1 Tax=Schaedlerella arabinosiphila TaxID=2044587 RepID=A0A3R8JP10_9FIRM|nr:trigger factor [Schaedlerella arabinosiphila]MCI8722215.1 trigger factor [Ruminococcus sp.]MCI9213276.1 trigger factor [Ruminococcus sp.]MCI9604316.1 trigger factor [Ruminococcus sp.]MCI9633317.1 trigger factor [Ruminococcus sp.]NDO68431.1 trigger factor [Schaedlerella arabinosiphila]